ncbi:hypothetical protein DP116_19365, partial [Brasilonema bromeliae SPC951]|nr:hypothetical protein [Brasilonema bromeliae SPC951]
MAFESYANNLVPGDTNDTGDIFLYDTQTRTTSRVSVDSQGNQGNNESFSPSISADGRYVAFASYANNLVPRDTNDTADIFVYDTQTRSTKRVSIDSQRNQGNDLSYNSVISASGRYVAYESYASNLVVGDTNNSRDIFLYDTITNNAPTNLALSATSVDEKVPVATEIGAFTTTDPDTNDQHTYSLVTGTGDADNAVFSINGNKLLINNSPNASKSSYNIRARTTDKGGLYFDKQFTINVNLSVN